MFKVSSVCKQTSVCMKNIGKPVYDERSRFLIYSIETLFIHIEVYLHTEGTLNL